MTIRSYCFLQDSLKILIYKLNLEKKKKQRKTTRDAQAMHIVEHRYAP